MKKVNPISKTVKHILVAGLTVVGLSACSNDISDLHKEVQDAKTNQKVKVPPLPEIKPHETFRYAAGHLKDPFEPFSLKSAGVIEKVKGSKGKGPRPVEGRPRELLEGYPLDSLRMVGTLQQKDTQWALIKTNDGTIHRVKTGNYLGQNHGKITNISEEKIELTEIVSDGLGDWMERPASMALAEDPKGGKS